MTDLEAKAASDHAMAYNDACVDIATAIRALKTTQS